MSTFLNTGWDFNSMGSEDDLLTNINSQGVGGGQSNWMGKASIMTAIFGGLTSAVGSFFAAKQASYQLKSQASSYRFQSDMQAINARAAENDAQSILESGKSQVAQYTMAAGQQKQGARASMAGRGIALGQGSAADVEASMDLVKDMDVLTINSNAVRAAAAERMQATNYRNASLLLRTSGNNADMGARTISPFMTATTSLIGSATRLANTWNNNKRARYMMGEYGYYGGY